MRPTLTLLAALFFGGQALAESAFNSEISTLCEKTKSCAVAEMKKSLPANMQEMAISMVSQACVSIEQSYAYLENGKHADLVASATACMKSMSSLSCEELLDDPETQACKDYEKEAAKYDSNQSS
ncbi:MAG: hypothetical protein AAF542_25245 [Pseudomonadota bacterium]